MLQVAPTVFEGRRQRLKDDADECQSKGCETCQQVFSGVGGNERLEEEIVFDVGVKVGSLGAGIGALDSRGVTKNNEGCIVIPWRRLGGPLRTFLLWVAEGESVE